MKTIFDVDLRNELIQRIDSLTTSNKPLWGKMNVYQMTRHCTIWNEWVLGKEGFVYTQDFFGKIFGRWALTSNTKDDRPMSKNMPAGKMFTVKEASVDLNFQKRIWRDQIAAYEYFSNENFIHDFFGKMTEGQIGIFSYKHNDHHLRQFNA